MKRAAGFIVPAGTLALSACGTESTLPISPRDAIVAGAQRTLAGCTVPLDPNGDINEAGLTAAGWTPATRTRSAIVEVNNTVGPQDQPQPPTRPSKLNAANEHESSVWRAPGLPAELYLSRNGGPFETRMPGECSIQFRGDARETGDLVRDLLTRKYGRPVRVGTRSAGGDWLTPRWFESEIHAQYWRLPRHDVYWVSSDPRFAAIEVVAMPDRAKLDKWSNAQPDSRVYIPEPTPTTEQ